MSRTVVLSLVVLLTIVFGLVAAEVTYDERAIVINGKRRILASGSIHYARSTPEMWPGLINKAKEGGLDVIETFTFWNGHESSPGQYNFEGRYDLVKFVKLAHEAGLYVFLRIGPYACGEWNFGGFPIWLKYIPGIEFRMDNEPFKVAAKGFVQKIVDLMKSERLFEPQGGPIIMSQIENEYGPIEWEISQGRPGKSYTPWLAKMALGMHTGVPWIMCKQESAPNPIINTCNYFYCHDFRPNKPYKPKMWTEAYPGWYTAFGGTVPHRPVEDLAFAIARFVHNNGSFFNYYMYHGGTNFGHTSGRFVATTYDYDGPLDEYGLLNEPKWGHLTNLHKAIKQSEPALVSSYPDVTWPGRNQEVHVFKSKSGDCAAFLSNVDQTYSTKITFQNREYDLPPWSISILPDCKTEVYNTAKITSKRSNAKMVPVDLALSWESYVENVPSVDIEGALEVQGLWEQLNVTRDTTDYLWYMTKVEISSDEEFVKTGVWPELTVMSAGHSLHVFINGKLSGTVYGGVDFSKLTYRGYVNLTAGVNDISLLSVAVGLPNVGFRYEAWNIGVLGPVFLKGLNEGTRDMTTQTWAHKVGLKGESLGLNTKSGSSSVEWAQGPLLTKEQHLTWYKTTFNAPEGDDPVALDMISMGKGEVWVNGQSIGRHWPGYIAKGNCENCNYTITYSDSKCQGGCNLPSQRWYHVPRSWLKPNGNLMVVFEEWGGDPTKISLARRLLYEEEEVYSASATLKFSQ